MSKKGKKGKKDNGDQPIIHLNDGWTKINKVGVEQFFDRVEHIDEKEFEKKSIPRDEFLTAYDTIFTMCIQREPYNYSEPLYHKHTEALSNYFKSKFVPALKNAKQKHSLAFLREWTRRWRCNKWAVDGMCRMFMYLDRFFIPNSEDLLSTSEQGYTLFRNNVFKDYKETARDAILGCVHQEREKVEQDRDLLREAVMVFVELGQKLKKVELAIYRDDFQAKLIQETKQYYKQKSRKWMDEDSCPEYLLKAEACVNDEASRLQSYIDKSSEDSLMKATREELLKVHQKELLDKETGIARMLERTQSADAESARQDLARLYRLYQAIPEGLQPVAKSMKGHVCNLGDGFIKASKEKSGPDKEHKLIRNLIDLHTRFLDIVKTNFSADTLFHKALKEAFEEFINKEYYVSNLLAKFVHDILKKGTKVAIADPESTMDHVVMLYGYIRDKDIFERDYQMYLANRLLNDLSASEQSEKSMIGKLKAESGYHWTSKLEDMFKDIQRSKELMERFNSEHGSKFTLELSVSVCTTGAWPTNAIPNAKMPDSIQTATAAFEKFYLDLHSGRKLSFRMDQGKADLQVLFSPKVRKVLQVSTYQMMVLLMFNQKTTLTFKEMLDITQIPRDDLSLHVLSLAHPKIKVLRKRPNTKEIGNDDQFQINPKYNNPRAKIPIPLLQKLANKKADATSAKEREAIKTLRRHQMDAAIVRIMKARKTLKHPELLTEVVKQLRQRFTPSNSDIKKRITSLIDLEYLVRDENDRASYHYKM